MHDRGDERGLGAGCESVREVAALAGTARGDHGHLDLLGDLPRQRQVVAVTRPVRVDRGHEQLARAARHGLDGPLPRRQTPWPAAAVRDHLARARVDRADDRLRTELGRQCGQQLRLVDRGAVDGDLVGAAAQETARVLEPRDTPADRERHRQGLRGALDEPEHRPAALHRRGDVEEDDLVGAEVGIALGELDGVADVAERLEANALDDAPGRDVEAGDQALLDHRSTFSSRRAPAVPLRSGWNCTPARGPRSTAATMSRRARRRRRDPVAGSAA